MHYKMEPDVYFHTVTAPKKTKTKNQTQEQLIRIRPAKLQSPNHEPSKIHTNQQNPGPRQNPELNPQNEPQKSAKNPEEKFPSQAPPGS